MMRYMGWSYTQLLECPQDYLEIIHEIAREENMRNRQRNR